ncbi:hypothetical protein BDW59DRAFT_161986 [Aspergillus cavernicola]|uniref:CFEM domain-containing protein n=1 Tax=Aspergillus cavernicola TaxID=176166 RepID=A0ABR4IBE4_9EURO
MRFTLSIALLGATVVVAQNSVEDIFNDVLPSCLRSCATTALEGATGCDISDNDCLCTSDGGLSQDAIDSLTTELATCALNADCDQSDLEDMADVDQNELQSQFNSVCGGSSSSSSSDDSSSSSDDSSSSSDDSSSSSDDAEDGAITLSATNAILAAGAMMFIAAF